jgi:hypothetical protein
MRDRDTLRRLVVQRAMYDRHCAAQDSAARTDEYAMIRAAITREIANYDEKSYTQESLASKLSNKVNMRR